MQSEEEREKLGRKKKQPEPQRHMGPYCKTSLAYRKLEPQKEKKEKEEINIKIEWLKSQIK